MRTSRLLLLPLVWLLASATLAQPCDCPSTFAWMVTTFEQNDAGFQLVVDRKGAAEYAKHTEVLRNRAQQSNDVLACT
ncbi:MAG: hypothetical protein IT227_05700, partial [Flavobacteriales bacterium]|nr:hypothetical protein [Flavobacteriales bacterium]